MRVDESGTGYLTEIINRLEEEGAFDQQAFFDMVDEVLDEKVDSGLMSTDEDIESLKEKLKKRWPEVEESLTTGHDSDITEEAE